MTASDTKIIAGLLMQGLDEQEEAIRLIDKNLRNVIVAKLRRSAPSLPPEDIVEAYQDTLLAMWHVAKSRCFDSAKPLLPLLLTLAHHKAIDALRKRQPAEVNYDQMFDAVEERLAASSVGEAWRVAAANEDGRRIMTMIRETVADMPPRQHLVASVVMDFFPDVPTCQTIKNRIKQLNGLELTPVMVKRAWQEARRKIREVLVREGYLEA